jgi:hypothetical protein
MAFHLLDLILFTGENAVRIDKGNLKRRNLFLKNLREPT